MSKQAYKLRLPMKWKIYDVFHVSPLEQEIAKKKRVNEFFKLEFKVGEDKKYKFGAIRDSAIYNKVIEG